MRVLTFSKTFVRNISHSEENSARYYHKCMGHHVKYQLFLMRTGRDYDANSRFSQFLERA